MKVLISSSPEQLADANCHVTVEAEYGDHVVEGSILTLAHHGPRSENPCPCLGEDFDLNTEELTVGISHFDLDTLGGIMRVVGKKDFFAEEGEELFWTVAAQVDLRGPHRLNQIIQELEPENLSMNDGLDESDRSYNSSWTRWSDEVDHATQSLHAFWAWSQTNRLFAPRDGSVDDCTEFILEAIRTLTLILEDNGSPESEKLIADGKSWHKECLDLDANSLVSCHESGKGTIVLRSADKFVNSLYEVVQENIVTFAVVGYNTNSGAITVSVADPIPGFSCGEFVRSIWGSEAGGHASIGGSPRGTKYSLEEAKLVVEKLVESFTN